MGCLLGAVHLERNAPEVVEGWLSWGETITTRDTYNNTVFGLGKWWRVLAISNFVAIVFSYYFCRFFLREELCYNK